LRIGFGCSGSFLLSETLDHSKYSNIWSRAVGFHEETASL
jgi:hypothetical protein